MKKKILPSDCKKSQWIGFFLILPSLLGILVFYLIPFIASLSYTFTAGVANPHFAGLSNFRELLRNPLFLQAVKNTALFLMLGLPLLIGTALIISLIATKQPFRWQRWGLLLPMAVPAASLALGWQSVWGTGGMIGKIFGMPETDFLRGKYAFPLIILLYLLKNVGYLSIILTSAIRVQPSEYREGYLLESGSELSYIRRILLPMLSPILLFTAIMAVMNYFLLFRDIYTLYGDDPPRQVYMLQHFMNSSFYSLNYQKLSTAAFLTVLFLGGLTVGVLILGRRSARYVD